MANWKLTAEDRLEIQELYSRYAWGIDLADAEDEVGVVVGVELQDLEEAADVRLSLVFPLVHDEVVHQVLAAVPPVLPVVPKRLEVLEDRLVPLHPALPQVIEPGVLGECGQCHLGIGQIDAPGIAGVEFLDLQPVLGGELPIGHVSVLRPVFRDDGRSGCRRLRRAASSAPCA